MNRREFIQTFTQTSFIGVVALTPSKLLLKKYPVAVEFQGMLLKGSEDGQILSSNDKGLNWDISAYLGPDFQVWELYQRRQQVYARIYYKGHKFFLRSRNGATWFA